MKRTLLYVLLASLIMVFMFGCGKIRNTTDSDNGTTQNPGENPENPTPTPTPDPETPIPTPDPENPVPMPSPATPIDVADLATLKGTYNIDALSTGIMVDDADGDRQTIIFSDNCSAIQLMKPSVGCSSADDVSSVSQVVIDGDNASAMVLQAKTQVWGGKIATAAAILKTYRYTYMKSSVILVKPAGGNPPQPGEFAPFAESKGFNFRNMDTTAAHDSSDNGQYNLLADGRLLIDNTQVLPGGTIKVTLILTKTTDDTAAVDSNVLVNLSAPGFETGFVLNADIPFNPNDPIPAP